MGSTRRHPILSKETIQADGARKVELRVFCDERGQSVSVDVCQQCPVCIRIDAAEQGADGCVHCTPDAALIQADAPSAGSVVRRGVIVVDGDMLIREAVALFVERRVAMLVVADAAGNAQGVVHESRLVREIQDVAHARSAAITLGWSVTAFDSVASIASVPVAISETAPLREALVRMANAHQRLVLVIDECGSPIGLLRDVDALHGLHARADE